MENKHITRILWNYNSATSDGREMFGEEYKEAILGVGNVTDIQEHKAAGEGDRWFYDISYQDGIMIRVFNPNTVIFSPKE